MADNNDNDVDAGWDDIDAGWDAEASKPKAEPKPEASTTPAKLSAHDRITAETKPLPSMIPVPSLSEALTAADPEESGSVEDDVTAAKAKASAVVTIEPLVEESAPDAHQEATRDHTSELIEDHAARQSTDTVKRIKAITARTERMLLDEAASERPRDDPTSPALETSSGAEPAPVASAPASAPASGQAFEVPSPLKTSGSGPAVVQPQLQVNRPAGVNVGLIIFVLLLVLALGAVGAVILAAFF